MNTLRRSPKGAIRRSLVLLDGREYSIQSESSIKIADLDGNPRRVFLEFNASKALNDTLFTLVTDLLSTHSISYASASSLAILRWLEQAPSAPECIRLKELNLIAADAVSPSYRPFILATLRRWNRSGLFGLHAATSHFLEDGGSWEERGRGAYFSLLVNDAERGALTEQEIRNLQDAIGDAHSEGKVCLHDFCVAWFVMATGVRPVQAFRMTVGDVSILSGPEGTEVTLSIPLAKGEMCYSKERVRRRAPTELANILIRHLELLPPNRRKPSAPLFSFYSSLQLSQRIIAIFSGLRTWSDRLEGPIPVFPYRFRYTLGTRALANGASDHEVARLLTHRTTSCIRFYKASLPMLQDPIREHLGDSLGMIARSFRGRLIQDLHGATNPNDGALIRDFLVLKGAKVGACGTRVECHQHAPVACLTCPFFEPFVDAPWEALKGYLDQLQKLETEPRIRTIYDRPIRAVEEIMMLRDSAQRGMHAQ